MNKIFINVAVFAFLTQALLHGQSASIKQEFYNQLNAPDQLPQDIYSTLMDQKAKTFATQNLINSKIDQNELTTWNDLIAVAGDYINTKKRSYSSSMNQLASSFKIIISALNQLKSSRNLTTAGRDAMLKQLNDQLQLILPIRSQALSAITGVSYRNKYPQDWQDAQPSLPATQLPVLTLDAKPYNIKTSDFLDKFTDKNILASLKDKTLTPQAFRYIMSLHGITQDETLLKVIDTIEFSAFLLSNISSSSPIYSQRKAIADLLAQHLHELLPTTISSLEQAELDKTDDKPSTLLFAIAQTYGSLLGQLIKELTPA